MADFFRGRVPVCMRCGDPGIRQQTAGDGLWPAGGEGTAWVCDVCGHIGAPFHMDPATAGEAGPEWRAEWEQAAAELDEEAWRGRDVPRHRPFAVALLLVAGLFLVPGLWGIALALWQGAWWGAVRVLVGTGWLLAIGVVLALVGLRLWRSGPTPGVRPSADHDPL